MSTADYGILGLGPASEMTIGNAYVGAYSAAISTTTIDTGNMSGVYSGSLSSQGNMVAMQLNQGGYKYEWTGRYITVTNGGDAETGYRYSTVQEVVAVPFLTGYSRTYMRDPVQCTFGADSPMPAITGVMPDGIGLGGNMLYYLDLQLTRLTGSNYINTYQFINVLNQAIGWVLTSNNYLAALNNAEKTNLAYYRSKDIEDLMSQGFSRYKRGQALSVAFKNIGILAETIGTGYFGTPNAVAKSMIDHGLGYINNLSGNLLSQGVNFTNILDPKYTDIITQELLAITNVADLDTIQEVLETSVRNFTNPTDYCSIEKASNLPNDSGYKDMAAVGKSLHALAPTFNFTTGAAISELIDSVDATVPDSVKDLSTESSLLRSDIINNLRAHLPVREGYTPVTVLDIIGTASGYLTDALNAVNEGMQELYATDYGPKIRAALEDISRYAARIPLNASEQYTAEHYVPDATTGEDYYIKKQNESNANYYNLLNQLVADQTGRIPVIVEKINKNYNYVCKQLVNEHINFNKAGLDLAPYKNNGSVFGFVSSLPSYATDSQNIGIDTMVYGTAQNNDAGDLVRTILNQTKNIDLLGNAGVRIKGII